ncbi:MAG: hypothetical protein J6A91_05055 [Bacteroidales bacterium]|nr:hypothetical protein [Bacteroidales bacterium]
MKKLISVATFIALVILAASCQRENLEPVGGQYVTYKVSVSETMATKAIEGLTLHYEVYRTEGEKVSVTSADTPLYHRTKAVNPDGSVILDVEILNEQNFTVLFWAQAEGNTAFNCETLTNVSINKDNLMSNSDYEVFAGMDYIVKGVSVNSGDVDLTHPVAKLTVATTAESLAFDKKNVELQESSMTVKGLLSTAYNVAEGPVATTLDNTFEYKQAAVPNADFKVGTTDYKSVAVNYVAFADGKNSSLVVVSYRIVTSEGNFLKTIKDVPVRANYRTNIIGNLITEGADYDVTLDPDWAGAEQKIVVDAQSLQDQINSIPDGGSAEIILGGNIDLNDNLSTKADTDPIPLIIPANKSVLLNLNGFELSQSVVQTKGHSMIENKGNLKVVNGTLRYADRAELTSDVNYVSNTIQNSGTLTFEKGVAVINDSNMSVADYGYPHAIDNSGKLVINGGEFTNNADYSSLRIWCTTDDDTEVEIHGGTFKGSVDIHNVNGNANKAKVTITGGTFNDDTYTKSAVRLLGFGTDVDEITCNITGGTFNGAVKLRNYGSGYFNSNVFNISGGSFIEEPSSQFIADGFVAISPEGEGGYYTIGKQVAKVGETVYATIDEAIAKWTNNTTLTLLADVTLSDVVTIKSTEHHTLHLGTYTLTAADKKNAIEITPEGAGTAAKPCLTINAAAENPGRINAGSKACIYYRKTNGINDRLMVTINGGIFDGTISSSSNNGGQACPYFVFNGGVFNKSINLTKAMLKVTGGTFHGTFSCTGDSTAYRLISGGTFKSWGFMTADAASKFAVGSAKSVYDVGVYVNDEGYLVVGGPVITDFGTQFKAKATNPTKWSSYLQRSSADTHGLYYTNADMAITKHGEANVVLPE